MISNPTPKFIKAFFPGLSRSIQSVFGRTGTECEKNDRIDQNRNRISGRTLCRNFNLFYWGWGLVEQGLGAGAWAEAAWLGLGSGWGWACGLVGAGAGAGAGAGSIGWGWEQGLGLGHGLRLHGGG